MTREEFEKKMIERGRRVPKLYVRNPEAEYNKCLKDYLLPIKLSVETVKNGIILPVRLKSNNGLVIYEGGVLNQQKEFVAGMKRSYPKNSNPNLCCVEGYDFNSKDLTISNKTVIFGGCIENHFGHQFVEGMTRLWWLMQNSQSTQPIVFLPMNRAKLAPSFLEFLRLMNIDMSRIIVPDKPTQFTEIIIPDQSNYCFSGYTKPYVEIYKKTRDAVPRGKYEKIYLSRTSLSKHDVLGEEYFENHFRSRGFEIIAPETLPLEEQISIVAGAKEIACTQGTLSHWILIAQDNCKFTILNRCQGGLIPHQVVINDAINANFTLIDIDMNFLPTAAALGSYLIGPTKQWLDYIQDESINNDADSFDIKRYAYDYLKLYCDNYTGHSQGFMFIGKSTMFDLLQCLNRVFYNRELDKSQYAKFLATAPVASTKPEVIKLNHLEIIQRVINKLDAQSYLEIGVSKGDNFVKVKANFKVGVDPVPPAPLVVAAENENVRYYSRTSDDYFAEHGEDRFDVVFVDGLHEYRQALRDVENALEVLNDGGVIIIHDCKPSTALCGLPPVLRSEVVGAASKAGVKLSAAWTGDVWKTMAVLYATRDDLKIFTLDCDWGCGIITRGKAFTKLNLKPDEIHEMTYEDFVANKEYLINLKPATYFEEFLKTLNTVIYS